MTSAKVYKAHSKHFRDKTEDWLQKDNNAQTNRSHLSPLIYMILSREKGGH